MSESPREPAKPVDFPIGRQVLLAHWWARLVLLLCVWTVAGFLLRFAVQWLPFHTSIHIPFLSIISATLLIEALRRNGRWFTVGLMPGAFALREILWGGGMGLAAVLLIGLGALACGAEWSWSLQFAGIESFYYTFSVIFSLAALEELVFRGLIFQSLLERFGLPAALVFGVFVFALLHLFNPYISLIAFMNLVLAGFVFSTMYLVTRSLWAPIAFHVCWNFAQTAFLGLRVSGNNFGFAVGSLTAPEGNGLYPILLGGAFGIEEGLITSVFLLLILALLQQRRLAVVAPRLAAVLYRRQYCESALRAAFPRPLHALQRLERPLA